MPRKPGREVVYRGSAHRQLLGRRGRVVASRGDALRVHFYGLPTGEPSVWDVRAEDVAPVTDPQAVR